MRASMWGKTRWSPPVVIEDVPENAVVAGCPARVVKMKDEGTTQKTALEAALRKL